ncbi:hypothetical protein GCM10007919_29950 [Rhizobium indigoferae]|nr:hypothetical protein GCM10007919_29950 [Rhizobium indigoferae]
MDNGGDGHGSKTLLRDLLHDARLKSDDLGCSLNVYGLGRTPLQRQVVLQLSRVGSNAIECSDTAERTKTGVQMLRNDAIHMRN